MVNKCISYSSILIGKIVYLFIVKNELHCLKMTEKISTKRGVLEFTIV